MLSTSEIIQSQYNFTFFYNLIVSSLVRNFQVAIITPVIHYCMGGLECTVDAECTDKSGKVIPGLYVAGEAAGGIHGNNRLGGNSLLDPGFD